MQATIGPRAMEGLEVRRLLTFHYLANIFDTALRIKSTFYAAPLPFRHGSMPGSPAHPGGLLLRVLCIRVLLRFCLG